MEERVKRHRKSVVRISPWCVVMHHPPIARGGGRSRDPNCVRLELAVDVEVDIETTARREDLGLALHVCAVLRHPIAVGLVSSGRDQIKIHRFLQWVRLFWVLAHVSHSFLAAIVVPMRDPVHDHR